MGKNPIENTDQQATTSTQSRWLIAYAVTTSAIIILATIVLYFYPFDVKAIHYGVVTLCVVVVAESVFFIWRTLRASNATIKSMQSSINQLDEGSTIIYELHKQDGSYQPVYVSSNIKQILGYSVTESLQPNWWFENVHPEDRALTLSALSKVEVNRTFVHRYRFKTKYGTYIWLRDELRTFQNNVDKIAGQWSDISQDLSWLQDNKAITQRHLVGFAELNGDDTIFRADTNFRNLIGLKDSEPSTHHILDFISPTNFNSDTPTLETGVEYLVEFNRPSGQVLHGLLKISEDKQGTIRFVTLIDLSAFTSERRRLKQIAYTQPLTGLPNIEQLKLDLQASLERARDDELVALLNVNIREFHKVNDSYGVTNGDRVLQRVARRFQNVLPNNASLYCAWGDDFWILLSDVKEYMELQSLMDELSQSLNKPLMLEKHIQLQVAANIGACTYPLDALDTASLLSYASSALQRARRLTHASQVIFNQQMASDSFSQLLVKQQLQQALEQSQFEVYFQKISDFEGANRGYEALLRWNHEDQGVIPASEFIHNCDEALKQRLGLWIIEQVITSLSSIPCAPDGKRYVAINLFSCQLDSEFVEQMKEFSDQLKAQNAHICFELKEASLIDPSDDLRATLRELTNAGFSLTIDDFGAGFAGLTYLREFPISSIKVDREFINALDSDRGYAIVDGIVELSHRAKIKVHALGIETEKQFALARELNFDFCQGRFIHSAQALNELITHTD